MGDFEYTLGLFANMYPADEKSSFGNFIKRDVDSLEARGVIVKKAIKTSKSVSAYPKFFMDSFKLAKSKECDIFQAEYIPHSSIVPAFFKGDTPLVIKYLGDDGRLYPYENRIYQKIIEYMNRRADHIITVSEELKQNLLKFGGTNEKITIISTGVDTQKFSNPGKETCRKTLGLPLDKMICLYVGRLHPQKGIVELLKAAEKRQDILFLICGPGEIPQHTDNCFFTGEILHEKVIEYICAADCFILPSYSEGLPNVLMESLSCKTPVIATSVGGCPEVVENYKSGILIAPKDVNAIIEAIDWMNENSSLWETMGEYGRTDMIHRYEHEKMIDRLINVHMNLIA